MERRRRADQKSAAATQAIYRRWLRGAIGAGLWYKVTQCHAVSCHVMSYHLSCIFKGFFTIQSSDNSIYTHSHHLRQHITKTNTNKKRARFKTTLGRFKMTSQTKFSSCVIALPVATTCRVGFFAAPSAAVMPYGPTTLGGGT